VLHHVLTSISFMFLLIRTRRQKRARNTEAAQGALAVKILKQVTLKN
jgi:hypothetical protein